MPLNHIIHLTCLALDIYFFFSKANHGKYIADTWYPNNIT